MKLELNKIHLGDSYELIKQIQDKSIDCIYTDVPYLYQETGGHKGDLASRIKRLNYVELGDIRNGIDYSILNEFVRVLKKVNCFIWCSRDQILDIMNYFYDYKELKPTILVWHKTNPTPQTNGVWLSDLEYCLYFRESGVGKLNDGYELKSKFYQSSSNVDDKNEWNHPTIKPLELVKRHLLHTTKENDIVLDCFSGSGTTCVASKELNRRFIGIEIDERYHKISVDRLNGINVHGQTSIFTDFDNRESI